MGWPMSKVNYFDKYGPRLLSSGFNCVPIISGLSSHNQAGKAPAVKGWQRIDFNQQLLNHWITQYPRCGIGIQTRFTPAVDIDCPDEEAANHMRQFVEEKLGKTMARVGRAPKLLMLYRTEDPFTKVKSHTWLDDFGGRQAVEILGSGQQFVAFGIHPVTKKPYKWITESTPLECDIDLDLPIITLENARDITRAFDRYAKGRGWTLDRDTPPINGGDEVDAWGVGIGDDDDSFDAEDLLIRWEGTAEELAEIFEDLPPEDSYDKWFPVLAALKDAEREPDEFKEIARDWSARSDNYDEQSFEDKWENGAFGRVSGRVANIHGIVKRVARIRRENEVIDKIIPDFNDCLSMKDWMLAAERMAETEVFGPVRELAVEVATEAYKRINNVKRVPKSAIDYLAFDFSKFDPPAWLAPWVFDSIRGDFVNRRSFQPIGPYSFNLLNARALREMGILENILAEQVKTNELLGKLLAGGTSTKVADTKSEAADKTAEKPAAKTAASKTASKKPAVTVDQATQAIQKLRDAKGVEAAKSALKVSGTQLKLADVSDANAEVVFKQAQDLLNAVEEDEVDEDDI